jgi:YVTN family beta-propeller protein
MKTNRLAATIVTVALLCGSAAPVWAGSFVPFESGQVRPLALSPDGARLYAVNTPDNCLEVFDLTDAGVERIDSVPVGLEPVAVAVRDEGEVWVVNHLSDSVSVVDVASVPPRVAQTLLVGDEPRDIVFAGPNGSRAFVTAAHRGQNAPFDPQLTTPGVGRADVWVFDADALDDSLGGTPLTIVTLFGDTPRALAATPDGSTVYAAVFQSGNQTTTVSEGAVCDGGASTAPCDVRGVTMPGGLPAPNTNFEGIPAPETGLIVRFNPDTQTWDDELGRDWSPAVRFRLPDEDVFAIDADADPPVETKHFAGVGTVLFNMAVNPSSGLLYVSNTEARNERRFEGPGIFAGHTVRGHLQEARITVVDPRNGSVNARHLNKHIDYGAQSSGDEVKERSLATPLGIAVSADGGTLYVAAFGSNAIGILDSEALEDDSFVPDAADHVRLQGGGPSGLVLDEARRRLYALTRFDNSVAVVDLEARAEVARVALYNPEPPEVVNGRPFLYDATLTSGNGEASCSSCHVFGDLDSLAWDLGNPDGSPINIPNPKRGPEGNAPLEFHPMKGPMTTQTLRGMAGHGPMHWRGDRTGGNDPGGDPFDEAAAFMKFNPAFEGLIGRASELSEEEMQAFTDFILQVTPPPNPIRALDNSLTPDQAAGRNFFLGAVLSDGDLTCNGCHVLEPQNGFFGTDGFSNEEPFFDDVFFTFKIPQLRNMYQKVGMFGMPAVPFIFAGNNANAGDQIRGFGFLHDGSVDTIVRFLSLGGLFRPAFTFPGGNPQRRQVEQFVLAFDSNLAPIVGQQATLTATNGAAAGPRIDLLLSRARLGECDVTVKGVVGGEPRGWFLPGGPGGLFSMMFVGDRRAAGPLDDAGLRALAAVPGQELTYTCVPPGSGMRIGIDRDEDGALDRDELDAGTSVTDPLRVPSGCGGDCDNDGEVSVGELVRIVNVTLVGAPVTACLPADANHDGRMTIDELIAAVGHAIGRCPAAG